MSDDDTATVLAVHDLVGRYARLCDQRAFDEWAALFDEDARFEVNGEVFRGAAIRAWLVRQAANPAGCHLTVNTSVQSDGRGAAKAESDFVFVRRTAGGGRWEIVNVGRYDDRVVLTNGEWRFAERVISLR